MNADRVRYAVSSVLGAGVVLVCLMITLAGARVSAVASDQLPSLSISGVSVPEGDSGVTVNAPFTVTLSAASGQTVTVDYATADGTAIADSDYLSATGIVTFTPGITAELISVTVKDDTLDEDDETFLVNLSDPANATIGDAQGTGTIVDNDPQPYVNIDNVDVPEGNSGTVDAGFTVKLSAESGRTVTVTYATADGTAVADTDYIPTSGTLAFTPGTASELITVTAKGDVIDEEDEAFYVNLSDAANAVISDTQGVGTITDDDPKPSISIDDVSVLESDENEKSDASFAVMLSTESGKTVTVDYATGDGTADVITDYVPISGTLTFTPGVTSRFITVTVKGDDLDEDDETFFVDLSNPINADSFITRGMGIILDDDPLPTVDFDPVFYTVDEGAEPPTITVRLDSASGRVVTVDYATLDGTAQDDVDYEAVAGHLVFEPGDTIEAFQAGTIISDALDENDETVALTLTNMSNVTPGPNVPATLTILDDDPLPDVSIDSASVWEGNEGATVDACLTVRLLAESGRTVTVSYTTVDGTADASSDYAPASGIVTFAPGVTSQPITVTVKGDDLDEYNETFYTELSEPIHATISVTRGKGTIADDDPLPGISIDDVTVPEGDEDDEVDAVFTAKLSAESGRIVLVDYATADCTADAGDDYVPASGTATFLPGVITRSVPVGVTGDNLDEQEESFYLNLSNPANAFISDSQGVGTITDDDPPLSIEIDDVAIDEGDEGDETAAAFTVTLSSESDKFVLVDYATADGTAEANSDYEPAYGTVGFEPGVVTQTISVTITGDALDEYTETFHVNLTDPINAIIADTQGIGTIIDDDPLPWIGIDDMSVLEGDDEDISNAVFTVTLLAKDDRPIESGKTVTVDYATSEFTASAGSDYTYTSGIVIFTPGVTTQPITVTVIGDDLDEHREIFCVNLGHAINAIISDPQGVGTILDDDPPAISIADVSVDEDDDQEAVFPVTLSIPHNFTVTVDYATSEVTATAGKDYLPASRTVTFTPGSPAESVTIPIIDDDLDEDDEIFHVNLSNPTNATISDGQAVGTIIDDEHFVHLPLVLRNYARWRQWPGTEGVHLRSPSGCGDIWYAGTHEDVSKADAGVWRTGNEGRTWKVFPFLDEYDRPRPSYPVVADPDNCDRAFASVWGDIFLIPDKCRINGDLSDPYVYGLAISDTMLYAGTHVSGVYRTDIENIDCTNNIHWEPTNNGIDEKHIRSVTVTGNWMYAGARSCTLYVSNNERESWSEEVVLANGCEDAEVWSAAKVTDTHYAGLGKGNGKVGKGLYYTNTEQSSWTQVEAIPTQSVYGLAYDTSNDYLYVSVYSHGIYCCGVNEAGAVQDCCHYNEQDLGLTTRKTREIQIHNESLVVGSDDGIWSLPIGICPCSLTRPSAGSTRRPAPYRFGDIGIQKD